MSIEARIVKRLAAIRDSPAFTLDLQWNAPSGITVLFGPSGSGKTLLLNCLAGFVQPDDGRILVNDRIYFDRAAQVHLSPAQRRCGYIFQDHALFPHMTVRENLAFAAGSAGVARLEARRRRNELLERFDLLELADRRPAQLSGGQAQRAALARTLITEPDILLLDEPARGLDIRLRSALWEVLRNVREHFKIPILLVTHDMEECCALADRMAVIENGGLLQTGSSEAVIRHPSSLAVARLLGLHNIAPAEILRLDPAARASRLRIFGQEIDGPHLPGHLIGDAGALCILRSEMRPARAQENQLTLRVRHARSAAEGVHFECENGFSVTMSASEYAAHVHEGLLRLTVPVEAMTFTGR